MKLLMIIGVALLVCLPNTPASALDFRQAYDQLISENHQYQAQLSRLKAAKASVWVARSDLLPKVSLRGEYGATEENRESFDQLDSASTAVNQSSEEQDPLSLSGLSFSGDSLAREDDFRSGDATFSIEQVLFDPNRWYIAKRASSRSKESYFELLRLREQLVLELTNLYTGYLEASELKIITGRELNALNRHKGLTSKRFKDGLGTGTDVGEADSRYQLVYADFLRAQFEVKRISKQLEALLTGATGRLAKLAPDFEISQLSLPNISTIDFDSTHDTLLAKQQVKSAKYELKQASSKFLPVLRLAGRSRYFDQQDSIFGPESQTISNSVMLELEVPIFAGFGGVAQRSNAKHQLRAAKSLEQDVLLESESAFDIAKLNFELSFNRLKALEAAYVASKSALTLREKGYLEGLSSNLDLLDALRDTFRSERLFRSAVYEFFRQHYEFISTYREISDDDIEFLNKFLSAKITEELGKQVGE